MKDIRHVRTWLGAFALSAAITFATAAAPSHAQNQSSDDLKGQVELAKPADGQQATTRPAAKQPQKLNPRIGNSQVVGPQKPGTPRPTKPEAEPTVQLKPGEMPAIHFDSLTYDFGRIRAGADVVHDFWFTNTGNGPLEILSVKPG